MPSSAKNSAVPTTIRRPFIELVEEASSRNALTCELVQKFRQFIRDNGLSVREAWAIVEMIRVDLECEKLQLQGEGL